MRIAFGVVAIGITAALGSRTPAQSPAPPAPLPRTILAIGAHAGDMELTAGAVLAKQRQLGDRIVLLHLTLGERGNPALAPSLYADQKRNEAREVAMLLGAEVIFGPYADGEIPDSDSARRYVATVIRTLRPAYIITHARRSIHRDHSTTHAIVGDAVLLAALQGTLPGEPHRGVRGVWYAENWEDAEGFAPYIYVDVTAAHERWRAAVSRYEFVRGAISQFRYLDHYDALQIVRGTVAGRRRAVAFDVEPFGKRRVLDSLP